MSENKSTRSPRLAALGEWIVRRDDASDEENPYWDLEEPEPHPDPSLGCVRRGVCCKSSPGWFAPGEVEQAAALMGMEPDALVRSHLIVDGMEVGGRFVHVFAPVKLGRDEVPAFEPGRPVDRLYRVLRGTCTFYRGEQGCGIYEARPYECRHYDCTNPPSANPEHLEIAQMWLAAEEVT